MQLAQTPAPGGASQAAANLWSDVLRGLRDLLNVDLLELSGTTVTIGSIAAFIVVAALGYFVSRVVQRVIARTLRSRGIADEGVIQPTQRLVHYGIMVVALGIGLETMGIDLSTLFAAGAVAAVAIGFAMQNILQNFVSGVILLAERTITPTDVLEVDGRVVRVERMGIRATIARTRDEEELIIPNNILVQSTVKNYTLADSVYRLRTQVGVSYDSDLDRVAEVLEEAAMSVGDRVSHMDPAILLVAFGDSSIVFDVSIWIDDAWFARIGKSHLNMAIWRGLKAAGITIAFPQLDLHIKEVEQGRVSAAPSRAPDTATTETPAAQGDHA